MVLAAGYLQSQPATEINPEDEKSILATETHSFHHGVIMPVLQPRAHCRQPILLAIHDEDVRHAGGLEHVLVLPVLLRRPLLGC